MNDVGLVAAARTYEEWRLVFLSNWDWPLVWLLLCVGVLTLVLTWRATVRQPGRVRALLLVLRLLAVSLLVLAVLQPAVRRRSVTRPPNHVAVLIDLSRSMAIEVRPGGPPRLTAAQALMERSQATLRRWRERRIVDVYGFHADLVPWPAPPEQPKANGAATRMRSALEQLRERYRANDLAGVVLISDGVDNGRFGRRLSRSSERFVVRLGAPIHTVRVGGARIRDIALGPVHADNFAFVRNAVKVEVEVRVTGVEAQSIPVTLQTDGSEVVRQQLRLEQGKSEYRVGFEFVPQRVGKYVYRVSTPVLANEAVKHNNAESFMLRVIRDRVRVLQVCGRPSWDERFLRQLLKRDPNVDLISFFILRTPASLALVPPSELSLIPFPTEELFERELGSFDLVLLQNFNYGPYGIGSYLSHLRRYVEQGGGLAMLGGDLSFSSGGYHGTAVAEVLPVELKAPTPLAEQLIDEEPFRPQLTDRGWEHPILQLGRDREETRQLLAQLPSLIGTNLVGRARRGAVVLATHPRRRGSDGRPMPVLAVREVGKGRTMSLTSDSLWRWAFTAMGREGTRQAYDRFWHGAMRWLIRDPDLEYLRLVLREDRITRGAMAQATLRAYLPDYSPAKGVKVSYTVERPGGTTGPVVELVTDELGEARLTFAAAQAGTYRIRAWASIGERKAEAAELLLVERRGVEEQRPKAEGELLRQIAEASGGRFLDQADELADLPFLAPKVRRVNWSRDYELWNRWWFLVLVLVVFGLDWALRRRYGFF